MIEEGDMCECASQKCKSIKMELEKLKIELADARNHNHHNTCNSCAVLDIINKCKQYINDKLLPVIESMDEVLEGNIFMVHGTLSYTNLFESKVKNICNLALQLGQKNNNVLEIGFNSGFSTLLFLLSNPDIKMTCVDLGDHKYTIPCYNILKKDFGDRISLIIGNSVQVLPSLIFANKEKYDLIHIDGGHSGYIALNDMINSYYLSKNETIIIMDDYDFPQLHELWDLFVCDYQLKTLSNMWLCDTQYHDIKQISTKPII